MKHYKIGQHTIMLSDSVVRELEEDARIREELWRKVIAPKLREKLTAQREDER